MSILRVLHPEQYKSKKMLGIVDVPTEVENPKGNGKKERAHSHDRKYWEYVLGIAADYMLKKYLL